MAESFLKKGINFTGVCVIYFCHDGHGRFVMARRTANSRDEHGAWDIGGGGLEFGDTVEDTLRKEIAEEYCTDVLDSEFLGYRDVHREHEGKKTHWIALDFKVRVDPVKVKNGEPHKFDAVEWFRMDALPSGLHSQLSKFFEKYNNALRSS